MARNISKESLEQKIAKTEKAISKNREQYDRLTAELEELHKKQKAIQSEESVSVCGAEVSADGWSEYSYALWHKKD